ncbi:MAG: hypothetical protein E7623_07840 [Ruminococcaceae bacterium]|nr:hypothetical protein [Oscillospiraceae bacterium]
MVYHVHTVPPTAEKGRSLAIDRLIINKNGTLSIDGPSEVRRLLPSGVNGYYHITAFNYTISEEIAKLPNLSAPEYLFDGKYIGGASDVYSVGEGGYIEVAFNEAEKLSAICLFPSYLKEQKPGSADVLINGEYLIKDVMFKGENGHSLTVVLSELPEGTSVDTVKISLHLDEGNSYAALSEIVFISEKR